MSYSILSLPGLPNGLMSLSAKMYHNPYPFIDVIHCVFGERKKYDEFIWPRDHAFPLGSWVRFFPLLGLVLYYCLYQASDAYRNGLSSVVQAKLDALFKVSDCVFVVAHSHGNRILIDALQSYELPNDKKIVWLGQAPAFSGFVLVLKGMMFLVMRCSLRSKSLPGQTFFE